MLVPGPKIIKIWPLSLESIIKTYSFFLHTVNIVTEKKDRALGFISLVPDLDQMRVLYNRF